MNALVKLTGSEKQIAWAESIREGAIERMLGDIKAKFGKAATDEKMTEFARYAHYALNHSADLKTARWWIDNRDIAHLKLVDYVRKVAARAQTTYLCPDCETFDDRCAGGCRANA